MRGVPEEDIRGEYKEIYIQIYRDIYKQIEIYIKIYIYGKMNERGISSHVNVHLRKILTQAIRL